MELSVAIYKKSIHILLLLEIVIVCGIAALIFKAEDMSANHLQTIDKTGMSRFLSSQFYTARSSGGDVEASFKRLDEVFADLLSNEQSYYFSNESYAIFKQLVPLRDKFEQFVYEPSTAESLLEHRKVMDTWVRTLNKVNELNAQSSNDLQFWDKLIMMVLLVGIIPLTYAVGFVIILPLLERLESESIKNKSLLVQVEQSHHSLKKMTRWILHDLKTPIQSLLLINSKNILKMSKDMPIAETDLLNEEKILNQLRADVSALVENPNSFKRTRGLVNFQSTFVKVHTDLVGIIEQNNAEVVLEAEVVYLPGTAESIKSIIKNMISNSLKYAKPGVPAVIHIRTMRRAEGGVLLQFQDNGIGIEPKAMAHIFDEGFQASSETEGQGLGLSRVKHEANEMGWIVKAESEFGIGTVFSFTIPEGLFD